MGVQASVAAPLLDVAPADSRLGLLREVSTEPSRLPKGFLRRVSRGVGALSLSVFVNILSQVTVPIALFVWGKFRFGEWILLSGFVQLLKITDLGDSSEWVRTVSKNNRSRRSDLCSEQVMRQLRLRQKGRIPSHSS